MLLNGHIALFTGTGQGIVRASALILAAQGADLVLFDKNPETLNNTSANDLDDLPNHSHLFPSFFFKSIYSTLPCLLIKELKAQLTTLISRDPKTADQKPYTSNPDITPEAILSNMAFMIKVKRPRLRILMGSVKIIKIGRKKAFKMPRMAAANSAVKKPFTCIPSITYEVNIMAAVSINHRIKIPFILFFSSLLSFFK